LIRYDSTHSTIRYGTTRYEPRTIGLQYNTFFMYGKPRTVHTIRGSYCISSDSAVRYDTTRYEPRAIQYNTYSKPRTVRYNTKPRHKPWPMAVVPYTVCPLRLVLVHVQVLPALISLLAAVPPQQVHNKNRRKESMSLPKIRSHSICFRTEIRVNHCVIIALSMSPWQLPPYEFTAILTMFYPPYAIILRTQTFRFKHKSHAGRMYRYRTANKSFKHKSHAGRMYRYRTANKSLGIDSTQFEIVDNVCIYKKCSVVCINYHFISIVSNIYEHRLRTAL
jgi:hypothetical protein